MKKIFVAGTASLFLMSCKTASTAHTKNNQSKSPVDVQAPVSNTEFFSAVNRKPTFSQVKINSKIDAQIGNTVPTADATLYIENGNKIWMNIGVTFLNVARGIATPQGVKGHEKISKTYIDSDFSYLNKMLNVNFIDYHSLQNLLIGKTLLPVDDKNFILTKNAQGYTLTPKNSQKVAVNGKNTEYKISLDYDALFNLQHVKIQDVATPDNLEVFYNNWTNINGNQFPQNVKIILKGIKTGQILIENTKFDFSKMETPYSVPPNYTKKEIR